MHQIVLPADELNEFDLPRVCVVTGQTEGVDFKPVKFAWYPRWIVALVIINVIIAAVVAAILSRRVKGHLPFTEEAYKQWKMGQVFFALSFPVAIALFVGGCVVLDSAPPAAGVALIILSLATPIATFLRFARNRGPVVQRIDEGRITLKLPSAEAVLRLNQHLNAGRLQPSLDRAVIRSA